MTSGPLELTDGESAIVIDERPWPIVLTTWFGAPTERLVTEYFARAEQQLNRAAQSGERFAMIFDTYAISPPSAKVRQQIGEASKTHNARAGELVLASFTVIENPLVRGALTALSWIDPQVTQRTNNVATFDVALAGCLAALDAAGVPRPIAPPRRQPDPRRASRAG